MSKHLKKFKFQKFKQILGMSRPPQKKSELHAAQERLLHDESVIQRVAINECYEKVESGKTEVLGTGVNGNVIKLRNKKTGKIVAMKQIASNQKSARECTLHWLAQKDCEYITKIDGLFLNRNNGKDWFYVMMECLEGGELFDFISARDDKRQQRIAAGDNSQNSIFTEREVASMIRMLAAALYHLHKNLGIAHRDLKPENILLTKDFEPGKSGMIKLTDFGFAKEAISSNKTKALATACYTPYYVAPEVFGNERYDFACDIWSLGVILYILLVGYPPFYSMTGQNTLTPVMRSNIKHANFSTNTEEFKHVSPDAVDLIERMLKAKPTDRIKIEEVMTHPWIQDNIDLIPENHINYNDNAMKYFTDKGMVNDAMTEALKDNRLTVDQSMVLPQGRGCNAVMNRRKTRPQNTNKTASPTRSKIPKIDENNTTINTVTPHRQHSAMSTSGD